MRSQYISIPKCINHNRKKTYNQIHDLLDIFMLTCKHVFLLNVKKVSWRTNHAVITVWVFISALIFHIQTSHGAGERPVPTDPHCGTMRKALQIVCFLLNHNHIFAAVSTAFSGSAKPLQMDEEGNAA